VDVENLRRNYALTLDDWARRFDRNWEKVRKLNPGSSTRGSDASGAPTCGRAPRCSAPQRQDAPLPDRGEQGQRRREYPMSRAFLYTSEQHESKLRAAAR